MVMAETPEYQVEESADPVQTPQRLAYFPRKVPARFETEKKTGKIGDEFSKSDNTGSNLFSFGCYRTVTSGFTVQCAVGGTGRTTAYPQSSKSTLVFLGITGIAAQFSPGSCRCSYSAFSTVSY